MCFTVQFNNFHLYGLMAVFVCISFHIFLFFTITLIRDAHYDHCSSDRHWALAVYGALQETLHSQLLLKGQTVLCAQLALSVCKCWSDMRTHNDTSTICGTKCHRWRTAINIHKRRAAECTSEISQFSIGIQAQLTHSGITEVVLF